MLRASCFHGRYCTLQNAIQCIVGTSISWLSEISNVKGSYITNITFQYFDIYNDTMLGLYGNVFMYPGCKGVKYQSHEKTEGFLYYHQRQPYPLLNHNV
jgi:hypothetical protein